MATVYLARDRKHHRMVAIKVLRPEISATLGLGRFLQEIEIVAGLQHPHILPLLDSGEADGFLYYVMPYVEGDSLRERLQRDGEFPISSSVRILTEIADALAYAHSRNVVHRDMKPENVMLSGRHPLVMDFGIAKAVSPALGSSRVTTQGVALGTPAYMAPEQASADPHLDHRVDIYALGVIGYELLTGSTPFTGTSAQQILAAHLTQRPEPILTRRPTIPVALATIIMQCLEKRPADRPQSTEEILRALETMVTPSEGLTPTGSRPARGPSPVTPRRAAFVGGGAVLVLGIAGLLWHFLKPTIAPVAHHRRLTFVGNIEQQQISPDGELLAYLEAGDTRRLIVKDLKSGSVIPVATLDEWSRIRWSPDGASILHLGRTAGKWTTELFPRLGGPARPLVPRGAYGTLSPDGDRLATWYQNHEPGITVTVMATGAKRVHKVPENYWMDDGDWSPDGRFIVVSADDWSVDRFALRALNVATGVGHEVVSDSVPLSPPRWSPDGDALYYIRKADELCKILMTPDGLPRGAPRVIQSGLGAATFSITADGRRLTYLRQQQHSNLWLATGSRGKPQFTTTQLTRGTTWKTAPRLSPDGRLIAFGQGEESQGDIFVLAVKGGKARRVASGGIAASAPTWSPDGRRLAFVVTVDGRWKLRTIGLEGGDEKTYDKAEVSTDMAWAPYDRILYQRLGNRNFHWLDPATGDGEPLVANDSMGWLFSPTPSPDGQRIAVFWNRRDHRGVYLLSLRDSSQTPMGPPNSYPLGWSADGRYLYVETERHQIHRLPVEGGAAVPVADLPFKDMPCDFRERASQLDLVCRVDEPVSDVWMIENFDPAQRH
jgi:Tol biopolymer transport system component/tRNA A-37 threonylcarbamoyl transferase component Bud32